MADNDKKDHAPGRGKPVGIALFLRPLVISPKVFFLPVRNTSYEERNDAAQPYARQSSPR
jgi:hypothetical protein